VGAGSTASLQNFDGAVQEASNVTDGAVPQRALSPANTQVSAHYMDVAMHWGPILSPHRRGISPVFTHTLEDSIHTIQYIKEIIAN
jgi:hypothetical protein